MKSCTNYDLDLDIDLDFKKFTQGKIFLNISIKEN